MLPPQMIFHFLNHQVAGGLIDFHEAGAAVVSMTGNVEELTLLLIEQNKQITELQMQMKAVKK
jgi:hypothetical protein